VAIAALIFFFFFFELLIVVVLREEGPPIWEREAVALFIYLFRKYCCYLLTLLEKSHFTWPTNQFITLSTQQNLKKNKKYLIFIFIKKILETYNFKLMETTCLTCYPNSFRMSHKLYQFNNFEEYTTSFWQYTHIYSAFS